MPRQAMLKPKIKSEIKPAQGQMDQSPRSSDGEINNVVLWTSDRLTQLTSMSFVLVDVSFV